MNTPYQTTFLSDLPHNDNQHHSVASPYTHPLHSRAIPDDAPQLSQQSPYSRDSYETHSSNQHRAVDQRPTMARSSHSHMAPTIMKNVNDFENSRRNAAQDIQVPEQQGPTYVVSLPPSSYTHYPADGSFATPHNGFNYPYSFDSYPGHLSQTVGNTKSEPTSQFNSGPTSENDLFRSNTPSLNQRSAHNTVSGSLSWDYQGPSSSRTHIRDFNPNLVPFVLPPTHTTGKKTILACTFCRERKVACTRLSSGREDEPCSQCQKRGRKCEFPTESYRGLRKKRSRKTKLEDQ